MKIRLPVFILLMLCWAGQALAQIPNPGRNIRPPRDVGSWYYLSSQHFDVYFYGKNKELADLTARYAEAAYTEMRRTLEFYDETRFQLYVYASPLEYSQSNVAQFAPTGDPLPISRGVLYNPGNQHGLNRNVRTQVAEVMLRSMLYGDIMNTNVLNQVFLYMPDWYITGLTHLLGEGWTPDDEMYMRSLDKDKLRWVDDVMSTPNPYGHITLKKSVWYMLQNSYGPRKLSEIVYMTRLTRSVESAFRATLGARLAGVTLRWVDYVNTEFGADRQMLGPIDQLKGQLPNHARIAATAVSPDQSQVAILTETGGQFQLWLHLVDTNITVATDLRFGERSDLPVLHETPYAMHWAKEGNRIAITAPVRGQLNLIVYQPLTNQTDYYPVYEKLDWVNQMNWAQDGERMVLSGVNNGKTDLYLFTREGGAVQQLTQTPYDELHPIWSLDGRTIYYTSNGGDSLQSGQYTVASTLQGYDVFQLRVPGRGQVPERITYTPYANEWNLQLAQSRLVYLTDETGVPNLASLQLFSNNAEVNFNTNYGNGLQAMAVNGTKVLGLSYVFGKQSLVKLPPVNYATNLPTTRTREAAAAYQLHLQNLMSRARAAQIQAREDSLRVADSLKLALEDSAIAARAKTAPPKKSRFYVFDEKPDTTKRWQAPTRIPRRSPKPKPVAQPTFDIDKVRLSKLKRPEFGVDVRSAAIEFKIDPLFRIGSTVNVEFTDSKLLHRLNAGGAAYFGMMSDLYPSTNLSDLIPGLPNINLGGGGTGVGIFSFSRFDLSNSDVFAKYQYLRYPVVPEFNIKHSSRIFPSPIGLRYSTTELSLGVQYPINRYLHLGAEALYLHVRRIHGIADFLQKASLSARDNFGGYRLQARYDNVVVQDRYPLQGLQARVWMEAYYSQKRRNWNYGTINADVRKYVRLFGDMTLATRGQASLNFTQRTPVHMVGGAANWYDARFDRTTELFEQLFGEPEGLYFTRISTPVRGFGYAARSGNKLLALSAELRMPFNKMFNLRLNTKNLHNFYWIFFYDAGIAWSEGNPFNNSKRERRLINEGSTLIEVFNTQTPYIQGIGTGFHGRLLGNNLELNLSWGIDEGRIKSPGLVISVAKEF